jgi:DNA repair exonuclease SbcCD ATPase subunit
VGEANRVVAQASRAAGAATSAKVLETLVSRLKTQLASKEKRIAQLKDAVRELEKKLGDALTRSADVAARAAGTVSERVAARAGDDNRAAVLAEKLRRAQDALARLEARERDWNEEKRALLKEKREKRREPSRRDSAVASRASPRVVVADGAASPDADARAAAKELAAEREKTEELENRVKALTARNGKLDRLLRAERDAARDEAALSLTTSRADRNERRGSGDENRAEDANVDGDDDDDAGAKARREETLARWEEGVKLRKRAETLAKKLAAKTRELENAEKLVERGRNAVADAAKEKSLLSAKLRAANDALAGKSKSASEEPDAEAARALHVECEALHRELASTRRVVDVEQAGEIARLQRRVAELEEREADESAAPRPERSALETRARVLEAELLSKEDAALGLRFEAEQASARADRLQRRLDELFGGRGLEKEKAPLSGRDAASRRAQELEDVVDALKKVVEKQQTELSTLRARLASAARSADAAKAAKQLKQTVSALEAELAETRASEEEATALRRKCVDLERRLAAASRGRDDAATKSVLARAQAEASEAALRLAETRDALAASEAALDAARADAARARALGPGPGGSSDELNERLRLENADLRAELDALDPAFFDEVMEMKRAYGAQTETLARYEATLRRYAAQLGESFEPEPKR